MAAERLRRSRSPRHRRRAAIRAPGVSSRVAQDLADLLVVQLVFVGVVARRLEIEDAAVVVENVGEVRREPISETRAPAADSAPAVRSISACVAASARSQAGVRQKPMRGARDAAVDRRGAAASSIAARNGAMSSSVRQMMPSVSRLWHCILMPTAAELAKARLVADDAAERRRADHRAAGLRAERRAAPGSRRPRRPSRSTSRRACAPGCAG